MSRAVNFPKTVKKPKPMSHHLLADPKYRSRYIWSIVKINSFICRPNRYHEPQNNFRVEKALLLGVLTHAVLPELVHVDDGQSEQLVRSERDAVQHAHLQGDADLVGARDFRRQRKDEGGIVTAPHRLRALLRHRRAERLAARLQRRVRIVGAILPFDPEASRLEHRYPRTHREKLQTLIR